MHFDKGTKLLDVDAIKYTTSMVKESTLNEIFVRK